MENLRVVLASRPAGWVTEQNFRLERAPVPRPRDGEVLVKNLWLSLDPYMRGRMNDTKSYAAKQEIDALRVVPACRSSANIDIVSQCIDARTDLSTENDSPAHARAACA